MGAMQALTAGGRHRRHVPRARPGAGARDPGGVAHGRDVRQGQWLQPRPGRVDALLRRLAALLRRPRDRRGRSAHRGGPGAGRHAPAPTGRDGVLLRRRRGGGGRVPRVAEPGGALEAARCSSSARTTSTRWARALARHQSQPDIRRKGEGYGVPADAVDGMDVLAVEAATRRAAEHARRGGGPFLLELRTYRFRAHSTADPELYRSKEEVETWKQRDPIALFTARLRDVGSPRRRGSGRDRGVRGGRGGGGGALRRGGPLGAGRGPDQGRLRATP